MGIPSKRIYVDKLSGKDFEREQDQALLTFCAPKTFSFIKSIDRLGRNYREILGQWCFLTKESNVNDGVHQILSFVTENERAIFFTDSAEVLMPPPDVAFNSDDRKNHYMRIFPKSPRNGMLDTSPTSRHPEACRTPLTSFRRRIETFLKGNKQTLLWEESR